MADGTRAAALAALIAHTVTAGDAQAALDYAADYGARRLVNARHDVAVRYDEESGYRVYDLSTEEGASRYERALDPDAAAPADPLVARATNFDLMRVLEGRTLTFATLGGTPVQFRLYNSPEELMAAQREAAESLGGPDPGMSREAAEQLVQPVSLERLAQNLSRVGGLIGDLAVRVHAQPENDSDEDEEAEPDTWVQHYDPATGLPAPPPGR